MSDGLNRACRKFRVNSVDMKISDDIMARRSFDGLDDSAATRSAATMAIILLATWNGAGNFPPRRALVSTLVMRGHRVSVLAHGQQRAEVEAELVEGLLNAD